MRFKKGVLLLSLLVLVGFLISGCLEVEVSFNQPPTARFSVSPDEGDAKLYVDFDASASFDPDGDSLSYYWNFGDGTSGQGRLVNHTYQDDGIYWAVLTVTDSLKASSSVQAKITVYNPPPVCEFEWRPNLPNIGEEVHFYADNSFDPASVIPEPTYSHIVEYIWQFGDGFSLSTSAPRASHTYQRGGDYEVTLMVVDDDGASTVKEKKLHVNQPPQALFKVFLVTSQEKETNPQGIIISPQRTIRVDASASFDPDGSIMSYNWDMGDGTKAQGKTLSYTYSSSGQYTITLWVKDYHGAESVASKQISIH